MNLLFIKSIISIFVFLQALVAAFTMFELLGRSEKRFNVKWLRLAHRINGYFFILMFLGLSYVCIVYLLIPMGELSARAVFHSLFALEAFLMLMLKISFIRFYRQYFPKVPYFGITIFFLTVSLVASSGGYYLVKYGASGARAEESVEAPAPSAEKAQATDAGAENEALIAKGRKVFTSTCAACHRPDSEATLIGPGLKGILKRESLPVSGRPATEENIHNQIENPYKSMPVLGLSEEKIEQVIAFLKTL